MEKLKIHITILTILLTIWSCESWLDVNTNPNAPAEVDYEELLPAGMSSVAYVVGGRYQVLGALWSQHWTQSPGASQYSGLDAYDINSSTFDDRQFGELYSGGLQNLEQVRIESLAENEYVYYLMATVMQAYTFQLLADLYDQVPFSEALQGDDGVSDPMYELGSNIYDSLITRIDFALSLDFENKELKNPEERDLIFNGDVKKWNAFANTLKLRIALRQTERNPDKARQIVEHMYNAEVDFLAVNSSLDIFTNESGRRNPLYDTEEFSFGGNPNLILSNTLYSFLVDNGDYSHLDNLFSQPAAGGGHKALIQGDFYAPEEAAGINSNSYSKPLLYADDPVYLLSLIESNLLQAEAIIRYGLDDYYEAKDLYDAAVLEGFIRLIHPNDPNYSQKYTEIYNNAQSLISGAYSFPSEGSDISEFIKSIAVQKWLGLSGIQNLETFFEMNRTGYPEKSDVPGSSSNYEPGEITVSVNNVTSGKLPKRLIFPESEYANNKNTPVRQNVWERVWWDVNTD